MGNKIFWNEFEVDMRKIKEKQTNTHKRNLIQTFFRVGINLSFKLSKNGKEEKKGLFFTAKQGSGVCEERWDNSVILCNVPLVYRQTNIGLCEMTIGRAVKT